MKDCSHVPTANCNQVEKFRQREITYQDCHEVTDPGCKTEHVHETILKPVEDCVAVTKKVCKERPNKVCKTVKTQVCGGHQD